MPGGQGSDHDGHREMAILLQLIWRDEAGPAEACAQVRQMIGRKVTRQVPRAGGPGSLIMRPTSGRGARLR
jgi:beta-lactamase class A